MLLWTATPVEMHFVLPGALRVGDIGLPKMKLVVFAVIVVVIVATPTSPSPATGSGGRPSPTRRTPRAAMSMGVHTPGWKPPSCCTRRGLAGTRGALLTRASNSLEPAMGGVYVLKAWKRPSSAASALMGSLWAGVILGVIEAWLHLPPDGLRDAYVSRFLVASALQAVRALRRRVGHVLLWGRSKNALPVLRLRSDFLLTIFHLQVHLRHLWASRST